MGNYRITVLTDRLLRLEWNEQGMFEERATTCIANRVFPKVWYQEKRENGRLVLETESVILSYVEGEVFSEDTLEIIQKCNGRVWKYGEPISNLGGTVSTLDTQNGPIALENGVCSFEGIALLDDSNSLAFDAEGWLAPRTEGVDVYVFAYGHAYLEAVQDYYRLTGEPPLLPAYALGNWWSRWYAYSEETYMELMNRFKAENLPFSTAVIDIDWHITERPDGEPGNYSCWTGYTWNKKLFPDYKRFLQRLHEQNFHVTLNLHPASGVQSYEEMYPAMAEAMGVDAKSGKTIPFDLTDRNYMKAYFEILHHPYEEAGVDFWWIDWQQGKTFKGVNPEHEDSYLDKVTPLWMLNHYHMMDSGKHGKRPMIYSRYAGIGSQKYPVGFSGDIIVCWGSLEFLPYFTATASNIGYGWWSHDIGGFGSGYRDDELQARWIQFGVFSPIMKLHSMRTPFSGKEPWNFSRRTEEIAKVFLQLRHRMFPYLYTMNYRNANELIPLIQPMYYSHPERCEAYSVKNQYWFGSEMIAAPITKKANADADLSFTDVWLPEGKWIDFFRGIVYDGNRAFRAYRSLEEMPVFCKAGAIIPMEVLQAGGNTLGNKEDMEVHVFAGASNRFVMYEDGGEDMEYRNGRYSETEFVFDWAEQKAVFDIHMLKRDCELTPEKRNWKLCFRGFDDVTQFAIVIDGNPVVCPCSYDKKTATHVVEIQDVSCDSTVKVTAVAETLMHDNENVFDYAYDILLHCQENEDYRTELWNLLHDKEKTLGAKINRLKWYSHSISKEAVSNALVELLQCMKV